MNLMDLDTTQNRMSRVGVFLILAPPLGPATTGGEGWQGGLGDFWLQDLCEHGRGVGGEDGHPRSLRAHRRLQGHPRPQDKP